MYKCADLRCKTAIIRRFFVIRKLIYYTNSVSCGLTKKKASHRTKRASFADVLEPRSAGAFP